VQNLVGIDSAVTDLRMRKNTVLWIYLSICLSVSSSGYRSQFWADFNS